MTSDGRPVTVLGSKEKNSFLRFLAYGVVYEIRNVYFSGKSNKPVNAYSFEKKGNLEKANKCRKLESYLIENINAWIQEKYKAESKQEAAE